VSADSTTASGWTGRGWPPGGGDSAAGDSGRDHRHSGSQHGDSSQTVIRVDLRNSPVPAAERRAFELLHSYRDVAAGRVLVVDDATALLDHYTVHAAVRASRLVHQVICVAVGQPVRRDDGIFALRGTPVLDTEGSATLWVGDAEGVGWQLGLGGRASALAADSGADGASRLDELLDLLTVPAVFDGVVEAAGGIPRRVACPGYQVLAGPFQPATLHDAQARAVRALTTAERPQPPGGGSDTGTAVAAVAGVGPLFGGWDPEADRAQRIRPGSLVDRLRTDCRHAVDDLEIELGNMAGLSGLSATNPGPDAGRRAAAAAGAALGELRATVADELGRVDGRAGLDAGQRDHLQQLGISLDQVDGTDRATVVAGLRREVADGLDRGHPLAALLGRMRDLADFAAPRGSLADADQVDRVCPEWILQQLREPEPFDLPPAPPILLAAVLVGCAAAAVGGVAGRVTGPLLALAWLLAAGLALHRSTTPPTETAPAPRRWWPPLVRHALAAGAGVAVGVAVGQVLHVPVTAAPVALLSAAGLALALRAWWNRAVDKWSKALPAAAAGQAADDLVGFFRRVAVTEWVLSDARRFASDAARATANVLEEVAQELASHQLAAGVAATASGDRAPAPDGDGELVAELRRVVQDDMVDLVKAAVEPCWAELRANTIDAAGTGLAGRVGRLLGEYRWHLADRGPEEPPEFARAGASRARLAQLAWQHMPDANAVLWDAGPGGSMRQLCAAEDLPLLDAAPTRARLVRFAPRAAQPALGEGTYPADIRWTATGHLAGAVRLVPLRPGAAELAWPQSTETDDGLL